MDSKIGVYAGWTGCRLRKLEYMSTDVLLTIGTILVAIITAIMVGFIPWAYRINGRLTSIEVEMKFFRVEWSKPNGASEVREMLGRIENRLTENK